MYIMYINQINASWEIFAVNLTYSFSLKKCLHVRLAYKIVIVLKTKQTCTTSRIY